MVLARVASAFVAAIVAAPTTPTTAPPPPAKAELLVDVDTGRALYAQNVHAPLPPGSLTKVLTAMIAADWLPSGTTIPVHPDDAAVYPDRVGMKPGQVWPYDVTMHALLVDSANDAAYALADKVGGSLPAFARIMQEAAGQIGMSDHPFLADPAGLDGSEGFDHGNLISAWDLAIAARDMMANPYLAAIAGTKKYVFTGPDRIVYSILNHNLAFLDSYPGAIGVKTGYTDAAGVCLIAEAERGGRKMMAVVLAGANPDATAAALLNAGFATPVTVEGVNGPTLPPVHQPGPLEPPQPGYGGEGAKNSRLHEAAIAPAAPKPGHGMRWEPYAGGAGVVAAVVAGVLFGRGKRASRPRRLEGEPNQR